MISALLIAFLCQSSVVGLQPRSAGPGTSSHPRSGPRVGFSVVGLQYREPRTDNRQPIINNQDPPYTPSITGHVAGYRLAGIEPDGDPLDEVALQIKLSASQGIPPLNLIVDSYLENFKPDTTPVLPDLLHPKRKAQNLGGFLQGKALLTDDAGNVLYIGSFLAEAFISSSNTSGSNHAVMSLDGSAAAHGGTANLKGAFLLHKDGSLSGSFTGRIKLPAAARRQVLQRQGTKMRPLKKIISLVTVKPAPMMGKATTGSPGAPLRTGFSRPHRATAQSRSTSRHISPWTIAAAVGATISFLIAAILFVLERRRTAS